MAADELEWRDPEVTFGRALAPEPELSLDERLELGARDGVYFGHEWFPRAMRMSSPDFHYEMMQDIEAPEHQFVAWEVFRDGAKTTLLRVALAKRISYGLSRVAVFTSAAQRHAERTIRWLKFQIIRNPYWIETFGLVRGSKWTDSEIEIINTKLDQTTSILAIGMTGQTRGVNIDDYRPDFWVVDDPCNEENTATEDAREKTDELFFGAMQNTLVPITENPHSKMALAQTSLHKDDLINECHRDPTWRTKKYGIFDEFGKSRWEERWPTDLVRKQKEGFVGRGQLHIWMREKECKIVPSEGRSFQDPQFWDYLPVDLVVYTGIDPAREKHANPKKAHKAAIVTIGVNKQGVYLLDYYAQKQKNPEELWVEFFRQASRWTPRITGIEAIGYQQTLAWYFRKRMQELSVFFVIQEIEDRRRKADRIHQAYAGLLQEKRFFIARHHTEFAQELFDYSDGVDIDVLDAGAMAITVSSPTLLMFASRTGDEEQDYQVMIQQQQGTLMELPAPSEMCP